MLNFPPLTYSCFRVVCLLFFNRWNFSLEFCVLLFCLALFNSLSSIEHWCDFFLVVLFFECTTRIEIHFLLSKILLLILLSRLNCEKNDREALQDFVLLTIASINFVAVFFVCCVVILPHYLSSSSWTFIAVFLFSSHSFILYFFHNNQQ